MSTVVFTFALSGCLDPNKQSRAPMMGPGGSGIGGSNTGSQPVMGPRQGGMAAGGFGMPGGKGL